ncbi:MAG: hypothetical protein JNM30_21010, partial [Rhodospirillales bacterium]|nr:hypothetical protein [Rhodospirillales bacterium]
MNKTLIGTNGNDALDGGSGPDYLAGGAGSDTYYVDHQGDQVIELSGQGSADRMIVSYNGAAIAANVEILQLGGTADLTAWGSTGKDTLIGNSGNNVLVGFGGGDTLIGGAGNDIYAVYSANDAVIENAGGGTDWVASYLASYTLASNVEIGSIGLAGGGRLNGNTLANTLFGGGGNDTFQGSAGNDTIVGNGGTDTALYSGARSNFQVTQASNGDVTVRDLAGGEGVDLLQGVERVSFAGQSFSVAELLAPAPANAAPVVSAPNASIGAGQSVALSSLISVSDANGDAITKYRLADGGAASGSGYFTLNGTPIAANTLTEITAAQLAQVNFVGGSAAGVDTLAISAFDGTSWSDYKAFSVTTTAPANAAPVVSAPNASVSAGQSVALSSLISASDANGDAVTKYRLADGGAASGSGYFTLNGTPIAANTLTEITAAQLAQVNFVGGSAAGVDTLAISAFDGTSWSDYKAFSVTTTPPPQSQDTTASAPTLSVTAASGQEDKAVSLNLSAALGDVDGSESLSVSISGVPSGAVLSAGTNQGGGVWVLTPAQLSGLKITPPSGSDADFTLQVTATATESNGGAQASTVANLSVTVAAVADAPTLSTAAAS